MNQMALYTTSDAIWCRVLFNSLNGEALAWFSMLLANSINYFAAIRVKFGAKFATSRLHHLTLIAQVNVRQVKKRVHVSLHREVSKGLFANLKPQLICSHAPSNHDVMIEIDHRQLMCEAHWKHEWAYTKSNLIHASGMRDFCGITKRRKERDEHEIIWGQRMTEW